MIYSGTYLVKKESSIFCAVLGLQYADGSAEYETKNYLSSLYIQTRSHSTKCESNGEELEDIQSQPIS
jgi:hypothetical protein